jgi:hypothetical protein
MEDYADFLFAMPSFSGGLARVLDIGSTLNIYNVSASPQEADQKALSCDWKAVGTDLLNAVPSSEANNDEKGA